MLAFFTFGIFLCCNAHGVPFFRHQNSAFPSGEAPLEKLLERVVGKDTQVQFHISWDHNQFLVAKNDLLFDIEVSEKVVTVNQAFLRSEPEFNANRLLTMAAGKPARILKSTQLWLYIEVMNESIPMKGWVHAQDIKPDESDFGFYRSLMEAKLKEKPDSFSTTITTVPRLSSLRALESESQWIKVKYDGKVGFINKQYLISKIDFADSVLDKSGEWFKVIKIKPNHVIAKNTEGQKTIPVDRLIKIRTDDSIAYITRAQEGHGKTPQIGSKATVVEKRGEIWYQSILDGHNKIWWTEKMERPKVVTLTDQELRKKKISSISLIDRGDKLGLASAGSIYKTVDGITWKQIDAFQNAEYPVLAHPGGNLFVGPFRSTNNGETFEPFIKWDELAMMIKEKYNYDPKFFKMTKMEYESSSQIKLTIDTGMRKIKLLTAVNGLQMRLVK